MTRGPPGYGESTLGDEMLGRLISSEGVIMKVAVGIGSVIAGWLLATAAAVALHISGLNLPLAFARTYSDYATYSGLEILILTIGFGYVVYQVAGRRIFHWPPDKRPIRERVPAWMGHPTPVGLVVAWVVAVFTVVVYPVAIWMSWRYYQEWRAGQKKCPRCAERIKATATMCRHCGLDLSVPQARPAGVAPAG